MGLDVLAFERVELAPAHEYGDECYEGAVRHIRIHKEEFEGRLGSLLVDNCYLPDPEGKTIRFRAGSYSGYNSWRDDLSACAGYGPASEVWRPGRAWSNSADEAH